MCVCGGVRGVRGEEWRGGPGRERWMMGVIDSGRFLHDRNP